MRVLLKHHVNLERTSFESRGSAPLSLLIFFLFFPSFFSNRCRISRDIQGARELHLIYLFRYSARIKLARAALKRAYLIRAIVYLRSLFRENVNMI